MSTVGYNERTFIVKLSGTKIAAVTGKSATFAKDPVDVTTDDDDAWRRLLPLSASRSMDGSFEGVVTTNNFASLMTLYENDTFAAITLEAPSGDVWSAEDGFFFNNIQVSGAKGGYVAFTASIQSSGEVTRTPAP